ncbi:MAG: NUDIX domain-containing protein [Salinisphaeraceae bacterium]
MSFRYCPCCGGPLTRAELGDRPRLACPDDDCGHVFWNNPTPVVGAVVEREGRIVLARNVAWPAGMFGLITGFLEAGESPEEGVVREVKEELDLDGEVRELIGIYPFYTKNQILICYHVEAEGVIRHNEELAESLCLPPASVRYWPSSTGWAMKDWLEARGHTPERIELPEAIRVGLDPRD